MILQLRLPRWGLTIAILAGLLPVLVTVGAQPPATPPVTQDPFEEADIEFRSLYAAGRCATLAGLSPLIVCERDRLVLIRNGQRAEATVIPPLYHRLKSVSHIPLAIFVALAPYGDRPLDEARRAGLRQFRSRIDDVLRSLDQSGFSVDQVTRSRSLLQRCNNFLDDILERGKYEAADLQRLTRFAGPIVLVNASDAARAQIDAYHAQVRIWRADVPAADWAKLRVLVLGPQMPRKHNLAVQYFAKLLGVAGESRRLIYAEQLSGEQQGLNLLATHQLDSELSEAFFGDPERMEFDLLGNAASVYLDGLDAGP